jgi:hypothetical protein
MDVSPSRREAQWALLLLALGIVFVFAEAFGGRVPTMRDFVGFTFPSRAGFRAVFEGGELSSWNPLSELGLSRLAAPVHGALYPGHLLLLAGNLETGVVLTWLLHAVGAGLGGYFLARAVGVRPFAAVISGTVWALGRYAVSMWWNGEKVPTGAWLPWFALGIQRCSVARAMIAVERAHRARRGQRLLRRRSLLLLHAVGLAAAVMFARAPSKGGRAAAFPSSRGGALRSRAGCRTGSTGAFLRDLPARRYFSRNEPLTSGMAEAWSLAPARLVELLVPGWFGNPFDVGTLCGALFADDPTRRPLPWAVSIYAGARLSRVRAVSARRRVLVSLGGVAAFFLLLACGRHTPLKRALLSGGARTFAFPLSGEASRRGRRVVRPAGRAEPKGRCLGACAARLLAAPLVVVALTILFAPATMRANALMGGAYAAVASIASWQAACSWRERERMGGRFSWRSWPCSIWRWPRAPFSSGPSVRSW